MSERWSEIDDMELRQMEAEMAGELADFRTATTLYAERARARSGQFAAQASALPPGGFVGLVRASPRSC